MASLNEYASKLNRALEKNKPYYTYNRDVGHAMVIVYFAFVHAKEQILLLSKELDRRVYSPTWFIDEVRNFLNKEGAKLSILVEDSIGEDHPMIQVVQDYPKSASIKRVPSEQIETYTYNFMVVDNAGYRFEADREEFKAVVAFNSKDDGPKRVVARLREKFHELESISTDLL